MIPEKSVAEGLAEALGECPVRGRWWRARQARDVAPEALRARGAEVEVVALDETVAEPLDGRDRRPG